MHHDIIIIGTGAGGGTLARRLAPTGRSILILERGDFLPRERENWDEKEVFQNKRYLANETWLDQNNQPFNPYTHYWVGGNTKLYGAALLRMREHDFGEVHHFGGLSPAWPLSYSEFEPHYTQAEHLYSVHGSRGADPTEPWASRPLPFEALSPEPRIAALAEDLRTLGLNPFPVPLGVRADDRKRRTTPYRFSNFDGYPDLTQVKADAHVVGIEPALAHDNVTLITNARVDRLLTSPSGREITKVVATINAQRHEFSGSIVVVACGAINSAALFLRSASGKHPHGLANSSGLVGRNYMCHHNGLVIHISETPNDSQFQKHFGLTDFYRGAPDSDFPLGTIQLMGKPDLGTYADLARHQFPGRDPADIRNHAIDFFITAEDLPSPDNRVELSSDGRIRLTNNDTNIEAYRRLERKLIESLDAADRLHDRQPADYLTLKLGISGVSHQNGTLRFGTDPRSSVLDTNCKAHEIDNLYVADASFFPSSSAVNPSLTIMANALRVADHIAERLNAHATASNSKSSAVLLTALNQGHAAPTN